MRNCLPGLYAVVRRAMVDQSADMLRCAHGMGVTVQSVPGKAHSMPQGPEEMRQLMQFWSQHLSRRPTAAGTPGRHLSRAESACSVAPASACLPVRAAALI